jgi:hypothetical protein
MSLKSLIVVAGLAGLPVVALPPQATAQPRPVAQPVESSFSAPTPTSRRRIEINPRPLLYRRCVDWYELQHRPSGTVLFPQTRCWWVRG